MHLKIVARNLAFLPRLTLVTSFAFAHSKKAPRFKASQVSTMQCAAYTQTGTQSWVKISYDKTTGEPLGAQFVFALESGRVNELNYEASEITKLVIQPGPAGEMLVDANIQSASGWHDVNVQYEGNNFGTRMKPTEKYPSAALMRTFLRLLGKGDFGHVSKDPRVDRRSLGGRWFGKTVWNRFEEKISFKKMICMNR